MDFSLCVFFLIMTLLAVHFTFILDYINDVRQKANSCDFLIQLQIGQKAADTTLNKHNAFGPGTANKGTVQWWFKKFCKETRALEMKSIVTGRRKLTKTNWEQ